MENVVAVIVTYNRLRLLQEAVAAVKNQFSAVKKLLVINNGSTDGTAEWLSLQQGITIITLEENIGASGGFYTGIKEAIAYTNEWIWVMDDDTVCTPNALEVLLSKVSKINEPVGFIGSKCIWEDGSPHYMNVPAIKPSFNSQIPFNKYDQLNLLLTETSSWVSLLINAEAIKKVGLPYKEFFFWSDDCEYTGRISQAGYLGLYCTESIVLHKTPVNYFPDFCRDTVSNLWKHKYGFRNEFFIKKKQSGFFIYFFWLIAKVGYTSLKVIKIRKRDYHKFIGVLFASAWNSLFFNPKIDKAA